MRKQLSIYHICMRLQLILSKFISHLGCMLALKQCNAITSNDHISLTSISGRLLNAEKRVMVLPDPGGPHSTIGLCSASQL